jgi:2-methoxy-6-polyprenyl-1,4-benzoquinol methylase
MQTSRVRIGRQLLDARTRLVREPVRCFSASAAKSVKEPPSPPPKASQDGTTHFGFETIAEAMKEQRGEHGTQYQHVQKGVG